MTTNIYLDVDGVINALGSGELLEMQTGFKGFNLLTVNGFPIKYAPELVHMLNELADCIDVVFKWVTTWERNAASMLCPAIGLNGQRWAVLVGDESSWGGPDWWKLDVVRRDIEIETPDFAIWIDDQIAYEPIALAWARETQNVIAISPLSGDGLAKSDLNSIYLEIAGRRPEVPGLTKDRLQYSSPSFQKQLGSLRSPEDWP